MLGLIHIYCGDGKGKTTAAVGLAVRCAGGGGKVLFYQFLKDGKSCEISTLKNIEGIDVLPCRENVKFTFNMTDDEKKECTEYYTAAFERAANISPNYDMLVLDEAIGAVNAGFVDEHKLADFLKNKPETLEVVLTGRNPSDNICALADYISDIRKIKHPYDKGICARRLIEM